MNDAHPPLQILLHAPTAAALSRARANAANLAKEAPQAMVRIIVNAQAVSAALEQADANADPLTLLCPNSLRALGKTAPERLAVLPTGAVLHLAMMQRQGWTYIRA